MSKALIPAQRRERIIEHMAANPITKVAELCMLLDVSEATVRRDLEWLEERNFLQRTHGGAMLNSRVQAEQEYSRSVHAFPEQKAHIGLVAATLVEDGDMIFVNSGTTTTEVIRNICTSGKSVTIVTNNVHAAFECNDCAGELILLGGTYRSKSNSVVGRFALATLREIYADKVFLGIDGLSPQAGCTVPTHTEAELARLMMDRTRGSVIVVADHSKWRRVSGFEIASLNEIDILVTDKDLPGQAQQELTNQHVRILIADS